jgi:hypothetical protein
VDAFQHVVENDDVDGVEVAAQGDPVAVPVQDPTDGGGKRSTVGGRSQLTEKRTPILRSVLVDPS